MTGKRDFRAETGCGRAARPRSASSPALSRSAVAATALLLTLLLPCFDLRAELLFRSAQQQDGQQRWSAPRKYANPADTVYPRMLADGTEIASEEVQVLLRGYITQQDVYSVKVMESLIKRGRQRLAGNSVSLAGNGGDVDASLEIGRLLRKLGVSTVVARGEQCLSSCVFAFMGGDRRTVAGRIGIHRPYFSSTRKVPDRRAYYRQLQKRLQQYIEELDFPSSLYEAVMAVPPESVSILTAADLKKFYLQGMSPSAEDEADATAARKQGISVLEYLQQKAQGEPCAGVFDSDGACAREPQTAAGAGAVAADPDIPLGYEALSPAASGGAEQEKADGKLPGATRGAAGSSSTTY